MFRIVAAKPDSISETEANQLVDQWLQNNTPWTEDTVEHSLSLNEATDSAAGYSTTHLRGDLRFEFSDDMTSVLDQIKTDLQGTVSWYRIAYHQCTHDGSASFATVSGESVTATHDTAIELAKYPINQGTVSVYDFTDPENTYTEGEDYEIEYADGEITVLSGGQIADGDDVAVNYEYYESGGPCSFTARDSAVYDYGTVPNDMPTFE